MEPIMDNISIAHDLFESLSDEQQIIYLDRLRLLVASQYKNPAVQEEAS